MVLRRWLGTRALITALVLCATASAARRADAQEIRGLVRDSSSQLAIPGAVVSLLDAAGQSLARTITNERREFRLVLRPGALSTE